MLHYLSEDPWPLTYILGLAALVCLVALWATQRGKYLLWTLACAGLALAVLGIERWWVTDAERIEAVVYDLAEAVEDSDVDRVLGHMAPEADIVMGDSMPGRRRTSDGGLGRDEIRNRLGGADFDYVRISRLTTNAGALSRVGTAEFRAHAMGSIETPISRLNFASPPAGTQWSLGFRETSPGTWKVTRITPVRPPPEIRNILGIPTR